MYRSPGDRLTLLREARIWHDPGMTSMAKGANAPVASLALRSTLRWSGGPGVPDVDVAALLIQANGRVRGEGDFVFYNHPHDDLGTVRHLGKAPGTFLDVVEIDLARVPAEIVRIVLAASADGGSFGQVPDLALVIADRVSGHDLMTFAMQASTETAFLAGELYRVADGWKFRAIGQGYASGLAGLATDFGIVVDESPNAAEESVQLTHEPEPPAAAPPLPPVAPPPPPPVTPAPPAEWFAPPAAAAPPPPAPPVPWPAAPGSPPPVYAPPAPPALPADYGAPPASPMPAYAPSTAPEPPASVPPAAPPVAEPPTAYPAAAAPAPAAPASITAPVAPAFGPMHRNDRRPLVIPDGQLITRLHVGVGWAAVEADKAIDLDVSVITFDAQGSKDEIIWRRNLSGYYGAIQHMGDNRSGSVAGTDAEAVLIELTRVPGNIESMAFTINSLTGDRFTDLAYAYLRVVDYATGHEVARFDLTDTQPSTAVIMAMIKRNYASGGWDLRAIGEFHDTRFVKKLVEASERQAKMP